MNKMQLLKKKFREIKLLLDRDAGEYEYESDIGNLSEHVLALIDTCEELARLLDEQPPAPLQQHVEVEILTSEGMTWGQFSEQIAGHLSNGWKVASEFCFMSSVESGYGMPLWLVRLERPAPPAAPQPAHITVADLEF